MGEVNRVQLNEEACRALVEDAREQFDNGCEELWTSNDESQRPTLEACIEILGRLTHQLRFWPKNKTPFGMEPVCRVDVEFSSETLTWLERQRSNMVDHVAYLDRGENATDIPYYDAHRSTCSTSSPDLSAQREAVAV